jgi:tetrahydromethanopterin S-methyltransferase subunit G
MPAASLDTHKLVKELTATGFTEEQAEALTRALLVGRELDLSHLATEAGVAEQARRLDQKIDRVYGEFDRKIDAVHAELDRKIGGLDRKIDAVHAELDRKIDALDRKIDAVRAELERRIDGIRADMEVLKRDMTIRLGAMIAAAVVLITALDRLL